jgi:hypothetical protein
VNYTVEPEDAGVHSAFRIRSASWDERRSIQAGESAGARVYWSAGDGDHANLMIGEDDETWDVSVAVPYTVIDQVVQVLRSP